MAVVTSQRHRQGIDMARKGRVLNVTLPRSERETVRISKTGAISNLTHPHFECGWEKNTVTLNDGIRRGKEKPALGEP